MKETVGMSTVLLVQLGGSATLYRVSTYEGCRSPSGTTVTA